MLLLDSARLHRLQQTAPGTCSAWPAKSAGMQPRPSIQHPKKLFSWHGALRLIRTFQNSAATDEFVYLRRARRHPAEINPYALQVCLLNYKDCWTPGAVSVGF